MITFAQRLTRRSILLRTAVYWAINNSMHMLQLQRGGTSRGGLVTF